MAAFGEQSYVDRARAQKSKARADAEAARRSLAEFFRQWWKANQGTKKLEWTPYLQATCDEVQAQLEGWLVANGRGNPRQRERVIKHWERLGLEYKDGELLVQNSIFNLAPSTLKSTIILIAAPAWLWLHDPTAKIGASSGNDDNVKRDSNGHRELVQSKWYRQTFGITWKLKGKADAVQRWETTAGGQRLSRTWMSGWVGVHVDLFLGDDPDDAKRVWNEPARKATQEQFSNALENRIEHERMSVRIISQQRLHVSDESGHLRSLSQWSPDTPIGRRGWAHFVVPTRAGYGPKDFIESPFGFRDPRVLTGYAALEFATARDDVSLNIYPERGLGARHGISAAEARAICDDNPGLVFCYRHGEFMQPERFGEIELAAKTLSLGSHGVASQYDQNPEVIDGGMFQRRYWRFFRVADSILGQPGFYPNAQPQDPRPRPEGFPDETDAPAFILERDAAGFVKLDWLSVSVDATFGSLDVKTASNVGLLVIGGQGLRRFIFHDATKMRTFLETCQAIRDLLKVYPCKRVLIELKANGHSIINTLQKEVAEGRLLGPNGKPLIVVVEGVEPGGETKVARAVAMLPAVEAGLWYLLDGAGWINEFGAEVCVFPNAKRDDRVDAMSQTATYYTDHNDVVERAMALSRW